MISWSLSTVYDWILPVAGTMSVALNFGPLFPPFFGFSETCFCCCCKFAISAYQAICCFPRAFANTRVSPFGYWLTFEHGLSCRYSVVVTECFIWLLACKCTLSCCSQLLLASVFQSLSLALSSKCLFNFINFLHYLLISFPLPFQGHFSWDWSFRSQQNVIHCFDTGGWVM